jgi:hypothetical protein
MEVHTVWQFVVGGPFLVLGLLLLFHRRTREASARRGAGFHARWSDRLPWLYGPRPMRRWIASERVWRALTIYQAMLFIIIGLMSIAGIGWT